MAKKGMEPSTPRPKGGENVVNSSLSIQKQQHQCLGKWNIASQCPNKRSMILREDGIVDNKSSRDESSSISEIGSSLRNFSLNDDNLLTCVNISSLRIVEKLNLPTLVHPKPYKLQWLNRK
ncbi:hypothetical protein CR513_03381, partial [Mucuna pruriens]